MIGTSEVSFVVAAASLVVLAVEPALQALELERRCRRLPGDMVLASVGWVNELAIVISSDRDGCEGHNLFERGLLLPRRCSSTALSVRPA